MPEPGPPVADATAEVDLATRSHSVLANFRDLGGLPTADGRRIRPNLLYRGDASYPGDRPPSPACAWPPTIVVDLRSEEEQRIPSAWPATTSVCNVPLLAALAPAVRGLAAPGGTQDLYLQILRQSSDQLARIVRLVAGAAGPTLLHCTMGRDRTGVATAVVLSACGVDRPAIVADYEATRANLRSVLARLRAAGMSVPPDDQLPAHALDLNPAAIEGVLDALDSAPGGIDGWLAAGGASASDVRRLREKLVQ
jgi:protein-tyrosine phosphatase